MTEESCGPEVQLWVPIDLTVSHTHTQQGTMTFKVNTDEMELETTWTKLQIPRFSEPNWVASTSAR